ncbi:hypothetical protein ACOIXN_000127 [Vibrio vulnificus]|uniref:hypothetical protein n=1 Tax=Vibrio vulnificus TaxID=672 RepID=UPI001E2C723A|nr:hypothetical protein [Vibrio vulnificus]MCD1441328.1 hypothetical protein [Vibrio vulnificus]
MFSVIICSSNFFLITSVCQPLSVSQFVILANAGIHRTASVVARYYRFIASVVIGFALCGCLSVAVSAFPNATSGVCG